MTLPHPRQALTEFMAFVDDLDRKFNLGELRDWDTSIPIIMEFFTDANLAKIETVIPNWQQMTSYGNGLTCVHVTLVVLSITQLPEYQAANPEQQTLMLWVALFHDVEKILIPQEKDHIHAFRSAVTAARALPKLGFATKDTYAAEIEAWADLCYNAICSIEESLQHSAEPQFYARLNQPLQVKFTQDNRKLPEILAGIDAIFHEPAALIIKAILLHMSIAVVDDYPYTAALSYAEIQTYIKAELFPILQAMMLVDCDAWSYFNPETKASWRSQTLAKFATLI